MGSLPPSLFSLPLGWKTNSSNKQTNKQTDKFGKKNIVEVLECLANVNDSGCGYWIIVDEYHIIFF